MNKFIEEKNRGLYRRYSDDILLVLSPSKARAAYERMKKELSLLDLKIKDDKTDAFLYTSSDDTFSPGNHLVKELSKSKKYVPHYLGLGWGSERQIYYKASTLARRYRPHRPSNRKYWGYFKHGIDRTQKIGANAKPLKRQVQKIRRSIKANINKP